MFRMLMNALFGYEFVNAVHATTWERWIRMKKYYELVLGPNARKFYVLKTRNVVLNDRPILAQDACTEEKNEYDDDMFPPDKNQGGYRL